MSTPSVPPRPQRTQAAHTTVKSDTPLMPPRPTRKIDPSPDRAARSPLNDPSTAWGTPKNLRSRNSQDLPRRPPSVISLGNDIGHEGDEYSSFDQLPAEAQGVSVASSNEQTRNVSRDLPMHQPKASVPQATAKRQIQTVTGTDSASAAAAGIGQARPADDVHKMPPADAGTGSPLARVPTGEQPRRAPSTEPYNVLRTKSSFNRSTSSLQPLERSTSRPGSVHGGDDREHGIPEIGRQVPLLHMAGDVQAPSPAAHAAQHAAGIGFFNDGSARNHVRKRSSRQEFGPPDAYGLHHGLQDQFEKDWARKHPEEAAKEGYYAHHLPKPVSALTSEQLNRLVLQSEEGTSSGAAGTPDEQYAEEFLSRVSSAAPSPAPDKPSFFTAKKGLHPDDALELDGQPSPRRSSSRGLGDEEHEHEHTDGTPILPADELMKRPSSSYMHAAVTPDPDSHYDDYYDSDSGRRNSTHATSRPSSRPTSVHGSAALQSYHGGSLHRFISHEEPHHSGVGTPLEEIEEYEPLFPEDDKEVQKRVFKRRPELAQHHFPSHDVWEDTPSSLQYSATVSTPELEESQEAKGLTGESTTTFETPEQEAQRRTQNDRENNMMSDKKTFIKPQFKSAVAADMHRPGTHRFPSSDVWEDSPDSVSLVNTTTLTGDDDASTDASRPVVPARPQRKSKLTDEALSPQDDVQRDTKSPPIPTKPSIPSRPLRASKPEQSSAAEAAEVTKSKPPVPARPAGEKIASLKAGFMNDLNNRLKLGPQGPPKKEPEPEVEEESKAPLVDARKSRAKGPARRKPAAPPASDRRSSAAFAFSPLINCWSIDEEDELQVHHGEEKNAQAAAEIEKILAENEENNTESAAPAEEIATEISGADKPHEIAHKHRGSEAELKAALAVAGAAPSSYGVSEESAISEEEPGATDTSVQTGETQVTTTLPSGEQEKMTAFVGGKAAEDGSVVVKEDGTELQS